MPKSWKESTKPDFFCPGCGHGIALNQLGRAIDKLNIQKKTDFFIDIGCSLLAWDFFDIDTVQTHHGRTAPVALGYKMVKPERLVIAYVGDGGGYAIGLQSVLYTAFRNHPITVILINNGNYAMTGGQVAPTTLPEEFGPGFRGPELIKHIASPKAYIARATVSKPLILQRTLIRAFENQMKNKAFSFVEILSICPTNWKTSAKESFDRLEEMENYFSLGEIKNEKDDKK